MIDNATLAARLQSWTAFFSEEAWARKFVNVPIIDALDEVLAGPPAWVTVDPIPQHEGPQRFTGEPCDWDLDFLMMEAWRRGDPALVELADHAEDLSVDYLQHMN